MAVLSNGTNGWPLVACLEFKIARDRMPVRLHETLGPPSDAPFCRNGCLVDQKPIVGNRNGASLSTIETFDQSLGLWSKRVLRRQEHGHGPLRRRSFGN
jgi:hypothetical protein